MSAFSLNVVARNLNDCLATPQEMKIGPYLAAFKELQKLNRHKDIWGAMFGFAVTRCYLFQTGTEVTMTRMTGLIGSSAQLEPIRPVILGIVTSVPVWKRFFNDLGTVFGFINSDLESKVTIMEEYRKNPEVGRHYEELCSMITFENQSGAIKNQAKPSGSRTLLRLHRALEFVAKLFQRLSTANDEAAMGGLAQESYEETLARHHPWLIRKGAMFAFLALPTCKKAFVKVHTEEKDHLHALMKAISDNAYRVFQFTESVYKDNGFLDLP